MGFLAPKQAGRPGEPRSDQSEAEFGSDLAFIYIHNREMGGVPLLVKKGGVWVVFWLTGKQAGKGTKPKGRPLRAAYEIVPRCSIWYGANDLIKVPRLSYIRHHIFGTTYSVPHTVPHTWYRTVEGTFKIERYSSIISNIHIKIRPLV